MPNLSRYNIYKSLFPIAVGFAVLSFLIFLALTGRLDLSARGHEFLKTVLIWGTVPATLLTFVFGLLTKLTGPKHPKEIERSARDIANELLKEIAQSKAGRILTDPTVGVVRIAELIKECEHPMLHTWADRLENLHEMVPAYLLPVRFGETDGPLLDWHKYDLCIITAKENVRFATAVKNEILRLRPNRSWRIYLDETGGVPGVEQERYIKSVFYGGSWKCLALLSIHMISDKRNKVELNYAMQRAQRVDSHVYKNYLMPIAMDEHGLEYMAKDSYLSRYAENLKEITDPKRLLGEVVKTLLNRLDGSIYPSPTDLEVSIREAPAKRFAVALSFPGEHRAFVKAVAGQLNQCLNGEEIFYDENYAHELARPDMDTYLQELYLEKSELVVVFLCAEFADKQWCGIEWRAVRELIKKKRSDTIMPVRFDATHIPGLFSIDGYVSAEHSNPEEIADLIIRRLALL